MKRKLAAIWRILSLPCEDSASLMSASLDRELPWSERMAFRLHAVSCRSCRRFFKQICFMRAAAERCRGHSHDPAGEPPHDALALPAETKQRIERALQEAKDSGD
jgi:hypothetical protein